MFIYFNKHFIGNKSSNGNSSPYKNDMTEGKNAPPSSSAEVPFQHRLDRKVSMLPHRLVGVIDEGTSTVGFSIFTTPHFEEIATHRMEMPLIAPKPGWFEQDAVVIINNVYRCVEVAITKLPESFQKEDLVAIGITNQRETTVVWDSVSGKPLYNAIVWNDIRTNHTVDQVLARVPDQNKNYFKHMCGLPISPYFSALKIRWLKDNVPAVKKACREKRCKVGTIDSWIIWNLTKGSLHITDVTNASRTMLMNIETLQWDPVLLKTYSVTLNMLPQICSSSEIYGSVTDERSILHGVDISGILGNQQASLLGQMCIKPGQTKNTYRSGCFLLCNIGHQAIISPRGLLTTIAYKLGPNAPVTYALEGAVAVAGHALEWLEKKVRILPQASDAEKFAETVPTTGDVYFVPAFTGLYAPYWRKDARGLIVGLTHHSTKHHVIRAALESICFQTRDILECMYQESEYKFSKLYADGPLSSNNLLMQLQADTAGVTVFRSQILDPTAFGAAMCAAQAEGVDLFKFDIEKKYYENIYYDVFLPTSNAAEQRQRYGKWKRAVERSFDWAFRPKSSTMTEQRYQLLASVPGSLFCFISFAMFVHSMKK
ncbi:glycerol kinase-like isoform X1 [Glossina fuscipes]|uniref:glycerol kinase n=2 Tax=Glossina fuscipes TaxID=7396 RepID=A0A9C5Z150_9MUSC|nr:glycerol kinase-like isoform X1 [Glossina fuscipes]XP_037890019.1 glycerol kinase-like isoform X1 [Glossina fuscipes]